MKVLVTQSWPTLCCPLDCSLPGSSIHMILQARIAEWVAMPSSRGSSWPRNQTCVSCTAGGFLATKHPKGDQSWGFIGKTDVESETPILWPPYAKSWQIWKDSEFPCWERLRAGGEGNDRGWDGWMPSPTWWTWIWVDSSSWWWTERPGMLQFMGLKRVRYDWVIELNCTPP